MNVSCKNWLYRRPVASALVGVVALGLLSTLPVRETSARSVAEDGAVSARARVIDGDTLVIDGRARAPRRHRCAGDRANLRAPTDGHVGLRQRAPQRGSRELVGKRVVTCESRGNDKYGRLLGICSVDGQDINAQMVREGFAWAFVKYSRSYVSQEAEARAEHAGIWQAQSQPAWEYRESRWAGAEQVAPRGCAIKGNVTAHGHIYHMPWSPWYGKVKVEEAKGERWFCSEVRGHRRRLASGVSGIAALAFRSLNHRASRQPWHFTLPEERRG